MKRFILLSILLVSANASFAQQRITIPYAERDTCTLYMDIYPASVTTGEDKPAVLFMFGGGFIEGDKRKGIDGWVRKMTGSGYPVVSIDYRLGLKGAELKGLKFIKSLDKAIDIAVEDLFSATSFLLEHGKEYGINARKLVISGSSAGAIAVLQGEYEICNGGELAKSLPDDFNFAGVMSFSGAIFDNHNPLRFKKDPCPLLLFHGTEDKLVKYTKIAFFNLCFGGTNEIVRILDKCGQKYSVYRYANRGHDVCNYADYCFEKEVEFIENNVMKSSGVTSDTFINDPSAPSSPWGKSKPKALYN